MKIHLFTTQDVKKEILGAVFDLLSGLPGPFQFVKHVSARPNIQTEEVTWHELFQHCEEFRTVYLLPEEDFVILLTGKPNEANWFSATHPEGRRSIFIQTTDWDTFINCNPIHPVAYEVIENVIQMLIFPILDEGIPYFHDPAIGCMFDMCNWKSDITFKLRTGDICQECIERMQEKGIKSETIQQTLAILEKLRKRNVI